MIHFNLILLIVCLFAIPSKIYAEMPWGKDACLAYPAERKRTCCVDPLARLGIHLIRFHKQVISPADGPRSHFLPNSSQYTLDAMKKYGFYWGVVRGCDRLMRENSARWIYPLTKDPSGKLIKFDPLK